MPITVEQSVIKRIGEIRKARHKDELLLRITVDGGGCSGFQYKFELSENVNKDDEVFEGTIVTDETSLPFLNGSVIRYDKSLLGSEFTIENPNAKTGCGCGTSFSV
jgi:iron-sulfur cluster insertion protein